MAKIVSVFPGELGMGPVIVSDVVSKSYAWQDVREEVGVQIL